MSYTFKVGQIAYINYSKKRLIIPVKVVEQIVRKTESQEIVDWNLLTPDNTSILFSNLNVRRGLQQAIPLGMMVKYCRNDGSMRQMSFTMAQEAKRCCRGGGGAVSIDSHPYRILFPL